MPTENELMFADVLLGLGKLAGALSREENRLQLTIALQKGALRSIYIVMARDALNRALLDAGIESEPSNHLIEQASGTIKSFLDREPELANECGAYAAWTVLNDAALPVLSLRTEQIQKIVEDHTPPQGESWDFAAMVRAALAQASTSVPAFCAECGKTSTRDSMWALLCGDCITKNIVALNEIAAATEGKDRLK